MIRPLRNAAGFFYALRPCFGTSPEQKGAAAGRVQMSVVFREEARMPFKRRFCAEEMHPSEKTLFCRAVRKPVPGGRNRCGTGQRARAGRKKTKKSLADMFAFCIPI